MIRAVGIPPRWLRAPSDPYDTRLEDVLTPPSTLATVSCVAILAALLLAGVAGAWRRRMDIASGAAIGLLLCVAFYAVAASTPLSSSKVLGYTLWWGSIAGMWVWLMLGFSISELVRDGTLAPARARSGARAVRVHTGRGARTVAVTVAAAAGFCAALALAGAVAIAQPRDVHRPEYGPIARIASQLEHDGIPSASTINLRTTLGGVAAPLDQAIKFLLRRQGLRILQVGATARLGPWYELDHRSYQYVVYAYDGASPDPRARVIARASMREPRGHTPSGTGLGGVRTITVSIVPVVPASRSRRGRRSPTPGG